MIRYKFPPCFLMFMPDLIFLMFLHLHLHLFYLIPVMTIIPGISFFILISILSQAVFTLTALKLRMQFFVLLYGGQDLLIGVGFECLLTLVSLVLLLCWPRRVWWYLTLLEIVLLWAALSNYLLGRPGWSLFIQDIFVLWVLLIFGRFYRIVS